MKSRTKLIALIAGGALFVAAFFWLFTTHGPLAPVAVQIGSVVRADLDREVFGIGTVEAQLAYVVGPIAPGRVLRVLVDQGDAVQVGQLLAEMDPVDLDRRLQAARSSGERARQAIQMADAQVAEAMSRAKLAGINRDRDRLLFEQRVVSQQALDNSASEAERAEAALAAAIANAEAARQEATSAEAELQGLGRQRDALKLVSPADGIVVAREVEPGTAVVAGQAVLRLIVPESLWVRARVDQASAQGLEVGQPASIVLRSAMDAPLPGRVARIELLSDPVTEERVVNVGFVEPPARLYTGELAEVTIRLPGKPGVLTLPSAAIVHQGGRTGVWQSVNGRARFEPINVGDQGKGGIAELLTGLDEGERIVVYSAAPLKPGTRLRQRQLGQP
jgi:HlyD family secretion protein